MNYASRTMNLLRAVSLAEEREFRLGALMVRPSTREIVVDGRSEIVEPRVMQVLIVLAQADGAVVSRDRLIERCWGGRIVGDDAINNCVGKVRGLAALTTDPAFEVETVPRVGYRLIAAQPNANQTPQTLLPIPAQQQAATPGGVAGLDSAPSRPRPDLRKTILPAALAGAVLIVALLVSTRFVAPFHNHQMPSPPPQTTAAVLPFTPLYSDQNAGVYADEISSDVADTLGRTDLSVISPARSFQFRGDAKARAPRALHADVLVDGDVRRDGNELRVSIRVEDVASGLIILTKDIDRPASQARDLPDQVATFVAGALGGNASIRALKSDKRWTPRVRTGFIRAVFECPYRQDPLCAYETGRNLVTEAPDNAMAQTILAIATTNALPLLPEREKSAAIATARKAAWTAIRLDPHWGDPYIALGVLAADTAATETYLRRGLSISPDSQGLAGYLSGLLISNGRSQEALAVIQKVASRFTFAQFIPLTQIAAMLQLGQADDALEIAQRGRKLWPERPLFVLLQFEATAFEGDAAGTETLLNDPLAGPFPPIFADVARALRTRGAQDIGAVSRDCAKIDASDWPRQRVCLLALTMLGRIDEVFRLRLDDSQDLLFWPQTARLRADRRFLGLTERLHLLPYWKATKTRPDFCVTEHAPVCRVLVPGHA